MPIRSGKEYLIHHLCNCGKFYSCKEFSYKCSGCWNYCEKNGIMTSKEFGDKCRKWVKDNTVDEIGRKIILKNKEMSDQRLFNFLTDILKHTSKYITADIGLKLFKDNPTTNRGHIVGSFIADWWNIKSRNVIEENKWPSYMDCYYGNYSEDISTWPGYKNEETIPPRKPSGKNNDMVNNKIMMNIKYK